MVEHLIYDSEIARDENDDFRYDDEGVNLNKQLDGQIIAIADLGLWNGRRSGYKMLSHNLNSILDFFGCDDVRVYADRWNVRAVAKHHDGTHYIELRMMKPNVSVEAFQEIVYNGYPTREQVNRYTTSLVKYVNDIYGW